MYYNSDEIFVNFVCLLKIKSEYFQDALNNDRYL